MNLYGKEPCTHMDLNINSPAYFGEHYGVDDDVCRFCQTAAAFFKDKEYSSSLHIIGITPACAPQEVYDSGLWKESVRLIGGKECAIITIRMDFNRYYKADSGEKMLQLKETILKAVKKIKSRCSFDYALFEQDLHKIR